MNTSTDKLNWAVIGAGSVAFQVGAALNAHPRVKLVAAYSRSSGKVETIADALSIPTTTTDIDRIWDDSSIDCVYIATPNNTHREFCIKALEKGKHVLCEKPLAMNAEEAGDIINAQKQGHCIVMEAMWTRFIPVYAELKSWLNGGVIGAAFAYEISLGHMVRFDATSNLYQKDLGGGVLLDLGVYPLALAQWLFGDIDDISAHLNMAPSMVEDEALLVTRHNDVSGDIKVSFRRNLRNDMIVYGDKGRIEVDSPLYRPCRLRHIPNGNSASRNHGVSGSSVRNRLRLNQGLYSLYDRIRRIKESLKPSGWHTVSYSGNGYGHQIDRFITAIERGPNASEIISLEESMTVLNAIDRCR